MIVAVLTEEPDAKVVHSRDRVRIGGDSESKDGELNILVNKRYLVTIEGSDITDARALHEIADKSDFGTFASLK